MKLIKKLIYKYVDWEKMWYMPKNKFRPGDKVKLNWKAKSHFEKTKVNWGVMKFKGIDRDDVVEMEDGDYCSLYWLKRG